MSESGHNEPAQRPGDESLRLFLERLHIPAEFVSTSCGHDLGCLLDEVGQATFAFIGQYIK